MKSEVEQKKNPGWIIKIYPFALLLISIIINLLLGVTSIETAVPSLEIIKILSISAVLLTINHSWIMTATELTRLRFKIFATPEEWKQSGKSKDSITDEGQFEIERHLNTHRNTTENIVYYIFLAVIFSFVSPDIVTASIWLLMFPISRFGYTYCYFSGNDNMRGIFMSLTLLSVYGISSFLVLSIFGT